MKYRCENPRNKDYKFYGGRGITYCDGWKDFANFLADMGERPSPKHSLDRINNDGHYEPENCRWATRQEQMNNRQNSRLLNFRGRTQTVKQWADEVGVKYETLLRRARAGWNAEQAIMTPVTPAAGRKNPIHGKATHA